MTFLFVRAYNPCFQVNRPISITNEAQMRILFKFR